MITLLIYGRKFIKRSSDRAGMTVVLMEHLRYRVFTFLNGMLVIYHTMNKVPINLRGLP